ncbi:MAG TPA: thioredoxin domain-containing protein [Chthoniobacterales bacterium]|jgi:protein-disulfide isomerase|nr:thioredoxin domain-containing protein [Chthoniobacterales bacterium]
MNMLASAQIARFRNAAIVFAILSCVASVWAAPRNEIRSANAIGPANAPVLIEFFSDLQCPQCARYEPIVKSLKKEFGDKVRMVLRHYPLSTHEHALPAAWAAEAAASQGKFWEMAEALYKTQWMWGRAPAPRTIFLDQAKQLGLDLDKFQTDMDGPEARARVVEDQDHAQAIGVKQAPSVVINGYNVPNADFSEEGLRAAIKSALAKAAAQ